MCILLHTCMCSMCVLLHIDHLYLYVCVHTHTHTHTHTYTYTGDMLDQQRPLTNEAGGAKRQEGDDRAGDL